MERPKWHLSELRARLQGSPEERAGHLEALTRLGVFLWMASARQVAPQDS